MGVGGSVNGCGWECGDGYGWECGDGCGWECGDGCGWECGDGCGWGWVCVHVLCRGGDTMSIMEDFACTCSQVEGEITFKKPTHNIMCIPTCIYVGTLLHMHMHVHMIVYENIFCSNKSTFKCVYTYAGQLLQNGCGLS